MAKSSKATKRTQAKSAATSPLFLREAITLATPRGRLSIFLPVLATLALFPVTWLERTLPQLSICRLMLNEWCWSVGITRGVSSLLKAQFAQAWNYNPLSYLVLAVMLSIVVVDAFRYAQSRRK